MTYLVIDINDVLVQMMYKRTKGQGSSKRESVVHSEAVQRALDLMKENAAPISLVASPRTRIGELKAIFKAEYPQLDFHAFESGASQG
jgi:hypothetical protein